MSYIKNTFRNNRIFLVPYFILFTVGIIFIIFFRNDELLMWFNAHRSNFWNEYFKISTSLLGGIGITVLLLIALLHKYSTFFKIGISLLATTLLVELLKRITDLPRPLTFFANDSAIILNPVPGVELLPFRAFPSGHSASAFAIFFGFAMILKNQFGKLICLLIACSIAISRVYLLQHFTRDILAGSILGITITGIVFYIFEKYIFTNNSWYNKPLLSFKI